MLFIVFHLDQDRYLLDASEIAEILPLVHIKKMPGMPLAVAGVFNYHGMAVPVIDISEIALGRAAQRRMSTRIVLVYYPDAVGAKQLLGLIIEKTTHIIRHKPEEFQTCGVSNDATPYLGPLLTDAQGILQWIKIQDLLSPTVREVLFRQQTTSDAILNSDAVD